MTDKEAAYNAALVEFQKDLPHVGKDSRADIETKGGGKFGYSYADLTAITEAALPLLTAHGLAFSAKPTLNDAGTFVLRYELKHEQGHSDGGDFPLTQGTMQQIGSAITYARRYAFCAVTGIAPGGEDDDGAKASEARPVQQSEDPINRLKREIMQAGAKVNITTVDDLAAKFAELNGGLVLADATEEELREFRTWLEKEFSRGQHELSKVAGVNRDGRTKAGTHEAAREASNPPESLPGVPADDPWYEPASDKPAEPAATS